MHFERQAGQHDSRTGKRTGVRWQIVPLRGVAVARRSNPDPVARSRHHPRKLILKILRQLIIKITQKTTPPPCFFRMITSNVQRPLPALTPANDERLSSWPDIRERAAIAVA